MGMLSKYIVRISQFHTKTTENWGETQVDFQKFWKKTSSCLFLTKSLVGAHIDSGNCEINTRRSPCTMMIFVFQTLRCRIWILVVEIPAAFCTIIIFQIHIFPFKSCFRKKNTNKIYQGISKNFNTNYILHALAMHINPCFAEMF